MSARPVVVLEALALRARPTGVAASLLELMTALASSDRGCTFVVAAAAREPFTAISARPDWRVVVCPGMENALRRAWFVQRGLSALCRRHDAAILHSLQPLAPLRVPCPLVVTVHDLAWREMPEVVPRARRLYYDTLLPAGLRRASRVLASSEATADGLRRHFPDLSDRVRVTPLGTPTWVYHTLGEGRQGPSPRPYFLFVGALEPRKNLPRVLDAYERLLEERGAEAPDLRLVGPEGWAMGPLRERLARPLLRDRVRLCGYCDRPRLRQMYEEAVALVFPSLGEGFGLPVLEAMACGLPVLTSDRGALREVAGQDALLVDPLDIDAITWAMRRLVDDGALRERLRRAGPERAARWSWERTAEMTTAAYAELVEPGGRRK